MISIAELIKWAKANAVCSGVYPDSWYVSGKDLALLAAEVNASEPGLFTANEYPEDPMHWWEFMGYELSGESPLVIWQCRKCGYRRLAGWTAPHYKCPECTGRETQKGE